MAGESLDDRSGTLGWLPADLWAVVGLLLIADVVVLAPVLRTSPLRTVVTVPVLLFVPGYAVVAAVFPGAGSVDDERRTGIDGLERVALAVAVSIPVVGAVGLVLALASAGVTLAGTLPLVNAVVLLATLLGVRRRRQLPPNERFSLPIRSWIHRRREAAAVTAASPRQIALSVLLGLSVLVALASVTWALAAPYEGETYTEFYLLSENESGDLTASNYSLEVTAGQASAVTVGIENHEHRRMNYTVVGQLQRIGNRTTTLAETDRFSVGLDAGETRLDSRTFEPTSTGEDLRIVYLLYRGSPPTDPSLDTAYRAVRLPLNVTD